MKKALIILNYNDSDRTLELLSKVKDYGVLDHIVVVDNASTDGSFDLLKKAEDSKVTVIRRDENGGYAKGNNTGALYALKHFSPDILFIANPDVYFTEETAKAMALALDRNPGYAAAAPLVRQGYNVWDLPGFAGILESLFLIAFNLHKKAIKARLERSDKFIENAGVVEGSFFAVSAPKFAEIQGFDERTFLYSEEIILARRFKAHGYGVAVLPGYRYDHLHSASIKKIYKSSKAAAFHNFKQGFGVYNKYYLKTNALQDKIFDICWKLGYYERVLYDRIKNR